MTDGPIVAEPEQGGGHTLPRPPAEMDDVIDDGRSAIRGG